MVNYASCGSAGLLGTQEQSDPTNEKQIKMHKIHTWRIMISFFKLKNTSSVPSFYL